MILGATIGSPNGPEPLRHSLAFFGGIFAIGGANSGFNGGRGAGGYIAAPLAALLYLSINSPIDFSYSNSTIYTPKLFGIAGNLAGGYLGGNFTASLGLAGAPAGYNTGTGAAFSPGFILQGFGTGYGFLAFAYTIKPRLGFDLVAGFSLPLRPAFPVTPR